jgi:hypothetical protein
MSAAILAAAICKGWAPPDREREALLERHRNIFAALAEAADQPTIDALSAELEEVERLISLAPTPQ